jgi:hypothetical protein
VAIYLAGLVFAAGVFVATQRGIDRHTILTVEQHTNQLAAESEIDEQFREDLSEMKGMMNDFMKFVQFEHEARIREADKMDERIRHLERRQR